MKIAWLALIVGCQEVPVAYDDAVPCEQPIADYCANATGGCPASRSPQAMCAWMAARGTPSISWGGPLEACGSTDLVGWDVELDGGREQYLLFEDDALTAVLEPAPSARCLAGPPHIHAESCSDWAVGFSCDDPQLPGREVAEPRVGRR